VDIPSGATEADSITSLQTHANNTQLSAFRNLISHWQQEAYAHIPHNKHEITELINNWAPSFKPASKAAHDQ